MLGRNWNLSNVRLWYDKYLLIVLEMCQKINFAYLYNLLNNAYESVSSYRNWKKKYWKVGFLNSKVYKQCKVIKINILLSTGEYKLLYLWYNKFSSINS